MRNWNTFGLLCLSLLFLTACLPDQVEQVGTKQLLEKRTPSEQPGTQPVQPSLTMSVYPSQGFSSLTSDDILLHFEYEPTFSTPSSRYPYGRVPEFTLLADGRLFYLAEEPSDRSIQIVLLANEEASAILQEMLDLGIARLEDYTKDCLPQSDGTSLCIEDASFTILRQRLPDESLKEIRSYANFSNEPEILQTILQRLSDYTHPGAQPYLPSEAALFLQPVLGEMSGNAHQYPLVGNYAPPPLNESDIWAFYLSGEDLATQEDIVTAYLPVYLRFLLARSMIEIELYKDPEQNYLELWERVHKKYLFLDKPIGRSEPFTNIIYVSYPIYVQNYLIAEIMSWQIHRVLQDRYGANYVFDKKVGEYLKDGFCAEGEFYPWKTRLKRATGKELDVDGYLSSMVSRSGR